VFPGNFHGILERLSAGVYEDRFFRKIAGGVSRKELTHFDVGLVARYGEERVGDLGRLMRYRVDNGFVGVTNCHDPDAPSEV